MDDTHTPADNCEGGQPRAGAVTMSKNRMLALFACCLVAGYLVACAPGFKPLNPFTPHRDRPLIRMITRLAKIGLWVSVFAEPQSQGVRYARAYNEKELICHAEGW